MYHVAFLVFSPIIGGNLQKLGRKNAIVSGYALNVIATIGFGMIVYIQDE